MDDLVANMDRLSGLNAPVGASKLVSAAGSSDARTGRVVKLSVKGLADKLD